MGRRQGSRPSPRKMQKGKMMSEETLQIAEKRRETKGKGGKESHTHLNAELQRKQREIPKPPSAINAKK